MKAHFGESTATVFRKPSEKTTIIDHDIEDTAPMY